jgi:hypothetical protein
VTTSNLGNSYLPERCSETPRRDAEPWVKVGEETRRTPTPTENQNPSSSPCRCPTTATAKATNSCESTGGSSNAVLPTKSSYPKHNARDLSSKRRQPSKALKRMARQYLQWYLELERQDRPRKWYDYRKAKRDIEMVREFDAAIKDPEKVQQKTWSEVSSDHTITHDGSFHGSRISEIGFTGREDAERAYAHAKAEREARIAMYFAEREKRQALEAARQAGDTPSRPPSAPPSDQTIQDCLTGAAQKNREADTSDQQPNPETSPQQADTELEAESQPLLDLGKR